MARSEISFFVDDPAATFRELETPNAIWNSGMFGGASNSPGIGISTENPGLDESLPNWTLLDQHGNARNAQIGQCLGGPGFVDRENGDSAWVPSTELAISYAASGGQEGTLPDSTIRLMPEANLPTNDEKMLFDRPKDTDPTEWDGQLTLPANGADLLDLAVGWEDAL